jgi:hypothetical protein
VVPRSLWPLIFIWSSNSHHDVIHHDNAHTFHLLIDDDDWEHTFTSKKYPSNLQHWPQRIIFVLTMGVAKSNSFISVLAIAAGAWVSCMKISNDCLLG